MPFAPAVPTEAISAMLAESHGLRVVRAEHLAVGADPDSAPHRVVDADGRSWFLKARRGPFREASAAVPMYLHDVLGIESIMAPIPARSGSPWVDAWGLRWLLFPFLDGVDAFERPLSEANWEALGASSRAMHDATLPEPLTAGGVRESFDPIPRESAARLDAAMGAPVDERARRFEACWRTHRSTIREVLRRSARLARTLGARAHRLVPTHGDLHAGNVLTHVDGTLTVVDWDTLALAPRERDLMFVGGGVGGVWNEPWQEQAFYRGYGTVDVDPHLLAWYRHERIVHELVELGAAALDPGAEPHDREQAVAWLTELFRPGDVWERADRAWRDLPRPP